MQQERVQPVSGEGRGVRSLVVMYKEGGDPVAELHISQRNHMLICMLPGW